MVIIRLCDKKMFGNICSKSEGIDR
ncbi:hypothetical protein MIMGU_mgv1a0207312mg, partial [Erythranthe guttata]